MFQEGSGQSSTKSPKQHTSELRHESKLYCIFVYICIIYVLFKLCFQHNALAVGKITRANLFVCFIPKTVLPVSASSQER